MFENFGLKAELGSPRLEDIQRVIHPYIEKLKRCNVDERTRVLVDILESNFNEIISPSPYQYANIYSILSPREIKTANLIKQGKRTKEIAEILHLSCKTIASYRTSIRKKFGINNSDINLRSYLLSL